MDARLASDLVGVLERMIAAPQNLTAIRDLAAGVERHLADSLTYRLLPDHPGSICDIGSGGGMPGLVLALLLPDRAVTLVESERRKAHWLEDEARRLDNVRVVADRTEALAGAERERFDTVTARAMAPPAATLEMAAPLVRVGGRLVVWTTTESDDAWRTTDPVLATLGFGDRQPFPVHPFAGSRRILMLIPKIAPTPPTFPRRPGRAATRPLA